MTALGRLAAATLVAATLAGCDTDPARAGGQRTSPAPEPGPSAEAPPETGASEIPTPRAGEELLGQPAPPWGELRWLDGERRTLATLRGEVVLLRLWTRTCPYCAASAPAFRELHRDFAKRGLAVVAVHHAKPRGRPADREAVERKVERFGWDFPVALGGWPVVDRYWLDTGDRRATSASFLMDQHGRIRWVHPGPELHPDGPADHARCRRDYRDLRRAVKALL